MPFLRPGNDPRSLVPPHIQHNICNEYLMANRPPIEILCICSFVIVDMGCNEDGFIAKGHLINLRLTVN